jgi:hypothetical protein
MDRMDKRVIIILCIVFQLYSQDETPQDETPKDSSCGKAVFISTVALESVALAGYLTATGFTYRNAKNTDERGIPIIASFPCMGTYFLSSGIEKFVTLYQNAKLKKEGKERDREKSAFQLALYTISFLNGVATVVVTFAEALGGGEPYTATKTVMTTSSCLMVGQFIYDIHVFKRNRSLLKNDPPELSISPELKPYVGLSYKKDVQFGVKLYF